MSEDTTQQLLVARLDRLIPIVEETNARLQNVEARLRNVEERQDALKAQLENLDGRVEKRLQDTRPIWEVFSWECFFQKGITQLPDT
jgi:predicted transcriptional regulator